MGRNKILIQKIKDERIRNITFYKRKKGLIKKAMELSLLCEADILVSIYQKNISFSPLLIFSTTNNIQNFFDNYIKNPLIKKEIYGLKDYGTLFTNNILNEEQQKQIKEQENSNQNFTFNNEDIFNFDKNKIDLIKFPNLFDINKENEVINERFNNKNFLNNINLNKNENLSEPKIRLNNLSHLAISVKVDETKKEIKEKKNTKEQNVFNLPYVPEFLNDNFEKLKNHNNKFTNISNNIFNNNMLNIGNVPNNPLLYNYIRNNYNNYLLKEYKQFDLNKIILHQPQIPINPLLSKINNLDLNFRNIPSDKPQILNFPLWFFDIKNNYNTTNTINPILSNDNDICKNNNFLCHKRFNANNFT